MSTHVISKLADTLCNSCCSDDLAGKLAFGKKHDNDSKNDIDVTEEKKEDTQSGLPPKVNPNNPGIKIYKKKHAFTDKESKYELVKWRKLPKEAREAAASLGYDQEKWDDSHIFPHLVDQGWHDLSETDLNALTTLGWEEHAWEGQYQGWNWEDLPELQLRAAKAAGYTKENWWEDKADLDKSWDDLTDDQKLAMAVFGWTKKEWDGV